MDALQKREFLDHVRSFFNQFSVIDSSVSNYIACQFALESSFGSSNLAVDCCNLTGMKFPIVRFSLAISKYHDFSVYLSYSDCCYDYLFWMIYNRVDRKDLSSIDNYSRFLKKHNYCPESDYYNRIEAIYNQFFPQLNY